MIRDTVVAVLAVTLAAVPARAAEPPFEGAEERAALGEELRELFRVEPALVRPALGADRELAAEIATSFYADEIASDLALIAREGDALFSTDRPKIGALTGPVRIALLIGDECPSCDDAMRELDALAQRLGVAATLIDVSVHPEDREMMQRLTLDMLPAYVMPDKMIRGHMPTIALERYLGE